MTKALLRDNIDRWALRAVVIAALLTILSFPAFRERLGAFV